MDHLFLLLFIFSASQTADGEVFLLAGPENLSDAGFGLKSPKFPTQGHEEAEQQAFQPQSSSLTLEDSSRVCAISIALFHIHK